MTPAGVYTGFALPETVYEIAAGPDGNLWLSAGTSGVIRLTTSGVATVFSPPAGMNVRGVAAGSDGNVWARK